MNTCHGLKLKFFTICSSNSGSLIRARSLIWRHLQKNKIIIDLIAGFNLLNNNVITVSLAWPYRVIPSSSFEIGGNTNLPRRPVVSGDRVVIGQCVTKIQAKIFVFAGDLIFSG